VRRKINAEAGTWGVLRHVGSMKVISPLSKNFEEDRRRQAKDHCLLEECWLEDAQ